MSEHRTKRVQRSTTAGGLLSMKEPRYITPCKKPANQRAFGVLRSEDNPEGKPRLRRTRRSEADKIARLEFDHTMTQEEVQTALEGYGLQTYDVTRVGDDGVWVATSGANDCTDDALISHRLNDPRVTAYVVRSEGAEPTSGKHGIAVVGIAFTEKDVSASDAAAWLEENNIDFDEKDLNNSSGQLVLQRTELEEGVETRQIAAGDGVVFVVARADSDNIPEGYVQAVKETAYYGYGWGQLDFNANMADKTIGEKVREAQYILEHTLDNILYWNSDLTPDAKKALISRTCDQFANYVNSFLDQLPRNLLIPVSSETQAQRSEPVKETQDMQTPAAAPAALTKDNLVETVREVLRSEREAEDQLKKDQEAKVAQEQAEKEARRSEITEAVAAAVKPLQDEIATLKGTTVVRAEQGNEQQVKKDDEGKEVKRSDSVFTGLFGNIGTMPTTDELESAEQAE